MEKCLNRIYGKELRRDHGLLTILRMILHASCEALLLSRANDGLGSLTSMNPGPSSALVIRSQLIWRDAAAGRCYVPAGPLYGRQEIAMVLRPQWAAVVLELQAP